MGKYFRSSLFLFPFKIAFFVLVIHQLPAQPKVAINEIMSSNQAAFPDEDGDFPDWIELYNHGAEPVNLKGWGLSDNYQRPFKWVFPEIILEPAEFLLVWASGKDRAVMPSSREKLIPLQSVWKYLDDGSNQGTAWRQPGFDDSSWASGPAILGYDTRNMIPLATQISFGGNEGFKHVAYYFRKSFEVENSDDYLELELNLMIDDGAVVYLNGQEIVRRNMPGGTITHTTFATTVIDVLDISNHVIDASLLVNGKNTVAVQVHQVNRGSSDLRFEMELFARPRYLHTNFSISSEGEEIVLTHPEAGLIDSVPPTKLPSNVSIGRWPNGTGDLYIYSQTTPGLPNGEERYSTVLEPPVFSHQAGFYASPFQLSLTSLDPEVQIIYTIDGSDPDPANLGGTTFQFKNSFPGPLLSESYRSISYTGPLSIQDRTPQPEYASTFATDYNGTRYTSSDRLFKGTVIRAIAVKEGALPSQPVTRSYFVTPQLHNRYSFPVFSISTRLDNLFDYYTGIYTPGVIWDQQANGTRDGGAPANYQQRGDEWEKLAHLEFFDGQATEPAISQNVGIRIHGGWSRAHPMKSLRIYARGSYGNDYLNHPIFPDLPYGRYKRIFLRNSGNDWGRTMYRDAAIQAILGGLRCDFQAYRPSILFINGEYWGIHNIRERYDKYYLNRVYGVDPDNIDLLDIGWNWITTAKEGDSRHYDEMISFLQSSNMANTSNYEHVKTLMDVDNFMDYQIGQIYAANTDWPGNNNDFWRLRTDGYQKYVPYGHDGRWRWMVFDTDFGFDLFTGASHNTLRFATDPSGPGWPNPPHSTIILRRLLLNPGFRNQFINRFADLLNTHFLPERANDIINQMRQHLEPEIPGHIGRWGAPWSVSTWNNEVNRMNNFANLRPGVMRQHMREYFNLSGETNLTINVSDKAHGYVRVNTIDLIPGGIGISPNPYPWTGVYFHGLPVQLEAIPLPGYVFSHWEGLGSVPTPIVTPSFTINSVSVKAHFKASNFLYSWDFNNLPSGQLETVPSDAASTLHGVISYAGEGEGYMDRVSEGTTLNATVGTDAGFGLRVRNPSSARELIIEAPTSGFRNVTLSYATMRTTNGATIQEVQYRINRQGQWLSVNELVHVTEQWTTQRISFPAGVDNNPDFAIRILFKGIQAENESGNNRFDNIRIEGLGLTVSVDDPAYEIDPDALSQKIALWYANETLFVDHPWHGAADLTIYNLSGMVVAHYNMSGSGYHTFHFSGTNGLYIARLSGNERSKSMRFLVVNP